MKKILSLVLALVMMLSLSVTAFAAEPANTTYTVTIYLQTAKRSVNDTIIASKVLTTTPIEVEVSAGSTLKDAINKACADTTIPLSRADWGTNDSEYLRSLSFNNKAYTNKDSFFADTPNPGQTTYQGLSWMYFDGTPAQMPSSSYVYPDVSLGRRTVNANITITLSYEDLTFVW